MEEKTIEALKKRLSCDFAAEDRLREALTHRSYAAEHNLAYDNQRLEFLGDAVLEIILSEHLFRLYPAADEGELTRIRSGLVRESSLAALARRLELQDFIRCGKGELDAGGNQRGSTLADLFEAILGAMYLEAGFEKVKAFVIARIEAEYPDPRRLLHEINPKGELQELSQGRWNEQPEYAVVAVSGPEHQPTYEVEVRLHGMVANGRANGRKAAESAAARKLLDFINRGERNEP